MRNLCSDDREKVLTHSPRSVGEGLPVVVVPSGMLGRLVGCCPSDLVRQVYSSKSSAPNLPGFTQPTVCQLRGQSYYVEVALGFPAASADKVSESEPIQIKKELDSVKDPHLDGDGHRKVESPDILPVLERTFMYPPEAVLVPMVHQAFVRFSSKRMWLQGLLGSSSWETWPFWNFSPSSYFQNSSLLGSSHGLGVNSNFLRLRRKNKKGNGTTSSSSSVSSTSDGSERAVGTEGDLSADADSMACHPSDMPSNNDNAGSKVSKRPRSEITEVSSHTGKDVGENIQGANGQVGRPWGWDDEGVVMDINILLSEFGDFSDFFQEEELDFGEVTYYALCPDIDMLTSAATDFFVQLGTNFDASMRSATWDNSWQPNRAGGLLDPSKIPDLCVQDDRKYTFEPLLVLAEPGSIDPIASIESSKSGADAGGSRVYGSISGGSSDSGVGPLLDGSESDSAASLHCCYGWTEDWRCRVVK